MKITMIAVTSANGKLTWGSENNIYHWTSLEDKKFFFDMISKNNLIIMGSGTYEAVRERIKLDQKRLRIVLTKNPERYKKESVLNQLEFSSENPRELFRKLSKKYKQALLVGGSKIYADFLKNGLIDEIYLTIEPVLFGEGLNLFADDVFEIKLKLIFIKKLNEKGTIILKYKVLK